MNSLTTQFTVTAEIALTNLPSEVRSTPPELVVESTETPFLETKYRFGAHRTHRVLIVRFSDYSEAALANDKMVEIFKKVEKTGFSVPTEKLVALRENVSNYWTVHFDGATIQLHIKPQQQKLSAAAPRLLQNVPFEAAFKNTCL